MKRIVLSLAAALLAVGAPASASPEGRAHSSVAMLSCDRDTRSAVFQGTMEAFGDAVSMEMRFTLQSRDFGTRRWTRVGAPPPFEEWLPSDPGVGRFVYDKGVDNLPLGAIYRVRVRYRFRDAAGAVVARARRRSKACRQPDLRPNLAVERVRPRSRQPDGTRAYEVVVVNDGRTAAPGSVLTVDVAGRRFSFPAGIVEPGDRIEALIVAPACPAGGRLVATADAPGAIDEADEEDNVLRVPCSRLS